MLYLKCNNEKQNITLIKKEDYLYVIIKESFFYHDVYGSDMIHYHNDDKTINGFIEVNGTNYIVYEFSVNSQGVVDNTFIKDEKAGVEYNENEGVERKDVGEDGLMRAAATDKVTSTICNLLMTYSGWSLNKIAALVLKSLGTGPWVLAGVALLFTVGTAYASTYC